MALANRSIASLNDATTAGTTLNIPVGSGNNRVVVAAITQFRSPVTVTAATLNGVVGTLVDTSDNPAATRRAIAYIWLDADLPSSAGDYTVAYTGAGTDVDIHAIHYSGAAQDSTPTSAKASADSGATSISLNPALTAGAIFIAATANATMTITGGQTAILASSNSGNVSHASGYKESAGPVSYSMSSAGYAAIAVSIEEAAGPSGLTITSVNTTNTAFSAQTDSAVVGTGLSASVVCTYAGIACTNESASSSTSLKITFPNFFTNNIKLGRNYEFKVVG
jgi:hypothetical protein